MSVHHDEASLSTCTTLPSGVPEQLGFSGSRLTRIDRWLNDGVSTGRLPGASVAIIRAGHIAYAAFGGFADLARGIPMTHDVLVRLKSMTKPLTSVAAMTLYEDGHFQLDDPVSTVLPYFTNQKVAVDGPAGRLTTVPAQRDITFRDLLTHTAGLTYGFVGKTPVDEMYRNAGVDFQLDSPIRDGPPTTSLSDMVELTATMPLLSQPGERWNYSVATDVLGHAVSVISGVDFSTFLEERVMAPLGMSDSAFTVPGAKLPVFAAHYGPGPQGLVVLDDPPTSRFAGVPSLHSGGGGVVSTLCDYVRFCQMLLNNGELGGVSLLGRKSVELMRSNQLPGDIATCGTPFQGEAFPGTGFGLGFSVLLDPARAQTLGSRGEFGWTGSAGTAFWVDPVEDLAVVFLTQLTPDWTYPLRRQLRVLVYQALR
jgi:CubicO group peptidase (beta-lactamase class C family)